MIQITEEKRPKKKLIVILGIIIVLIIIGIISYFTIKPNTSTLDTTHTVGDSTNVGPYNITVKRVKNTQTLGSITLTKNQTNNNFFVATISVSNTSNEAISSLNIEKNTITLTSNGKTYNIDDPSTLQASQSHLTNYLDAFSTNGSIKPKIVYSTPIVFKTDGAITSGDLNITVNNQTIDYKIGS